PLDARATPPSGSLAQLTNFRRPGSAREVLQVGNLFLNMLPGRLDMFRLGVGLSDAEAQHEAIRQACVRQVQLTALVQIIHQTLILFIAAAITKTNKIQRRRHHNFKTLIGLHPASELLSELHVISDMVLQTFDSVMANHKPQLQRSKAPSEWDLPV